MRLPTVPILQRYILRELLLVFFFLLSGVTVLLVFVGVFREVSASGLRPAHALQILPYIVPSLLPFTIPATLLLTVCVVYGRMAGDREVTAAKAAGINVLSLLLPALSLGGVMSLVSLLMADQVIPWAVRNIQTTIAQAMEEIFLDVLRSNGQVVDNERGFSITVMRVEGNRLVRPTFHYHPKGSKPVAVQAQEAMLKFDMDRRLVVLDMKNGHVDVPGQRRAWFQHERQTFPLPFDTKEPKSRHLTISTIRRKLARVNTELEEARDYRDANTAMLLTLGDFDGLRTVEMYKYRHERELHRKDLVRLRTEIHNRFALATSCFFFTLLGAPFAVLQARRQFLTTFFMCFLPILLIYYPVLLLTMNLCKSASAPPVTMWVANAVLLGVGVVVLRKLLRH